MGTKKPSNIFLPELVFVCSVILFNKLQHTPLWIQLVQQYSYTYTELKDYCITTSEALSYHTMHIHTCIHIGLCREQWTYLQNRFPLCMSIQHSLCPGDNLLMQIEGTRVYVYNLYMYDLHVGIYSTRTRRNCFYSRTQYTSISYISSKYFAQNPHLHHVECGPCPVSACQSASRVGPPCAGRFPAVAPSLPRDVSASR